jgi:small subunit ribosomal protein S3
MGQKANINSLHLSRNKDWNSVWYANNKEYSKTLVQDLVILNYLKSCNVFLQYSEVVKIRICRISKNVVINIQLTNGLDSNSSSSLKTVASSVKGVFPSFDRIFIVSKVLDSNELKIEPIYIAKKIARLIESRVRFKSYLVKNLVNQTFVMCSGVKILCKGRLNGADMADKDFLTVGSIPFQTLKAKINYGFSVANTAKGLQSIKVWIYNK